MQRKNKLKIYLNSHIDELSPEKKHQMIGALNEMEYILGILNEHKSLEVQQENKPDDIFLIKPVQDKTFVEVIKNYIKRLL